MSLASLSSGSDDRGVVMGVFQSSAAAARVVGPVMAGALYDLAQGYPFWMAAALVTCAAGLALSVQDHPDRETPPEAQHVGAAPP
jgi:predicted MFS family arabinose efflux permease